jgi:hypothetical protein
MCVSETRLQDGVFYIDGMSAEKFMNRHQWADGTPCGKIADVKIED